MDRREFAASLSDGQREFIEALRDEFIKEAEKCYERYIKWSEECDFDELTYNIYAANVFTFMLNETLPSAFQKIEEAYLDLINKRKDE